MARKKRDPHADRIISKIEDAATLKDYKKKLKSNQNELNDLLKAFVVDFRMRKPTWQEYLFIYRKLWVLHETIDTLNVLISAYEGKLLSNDI